MSEYLNKLRHAMSQRGYSLDYIELCISYATNLQEKSMPVIFDIEHFCELLKIDLYTIMNISQNINEYYNEFDLVFDHKVRKISTPTIFLKQVQKWIQIFILKPVPVSKYATAYAPKSSIFKNAEMHVKQECVVNLDFKHFFESISSRDVYQLFCSFGYTKEIAGFLTNICTLDGVLPQGAPTSPYISNLICRDLDKKLGDLASVTQMNFTRYADDLTFSGKSSIINFLPQIRITIEDSGFKINENKTSIRYQHQRQEVTGLIVNHKVAIKKEFLRQLKQEVHYCLRFGAADHMQKANISYSNYKDHLFGKAYFVKIVNDELGNTLLEKLHRIRWEY